MSDCGHYSTREVATRSVGRATKRGRDSYAIRNTRGRFPPADVGECVGAGRRRSASVHLIRVIRALKNGVRISEIKCTLRAEETEPGRVRRLGAGSGSTSSPCFARIQSYIRDVSCFESCGSMRETSQMYDAHCPKPLHRRPPHRCSAPHDATSRPTKPPSRASTCAGVVAFPGRLSTYPTRASTKRGSPMR